MGETDQEPDPTKRVPTVLWLMLGVLVVVVFAAAVFIVGKSIQPRAVGPPAGAPAGAGGQG